MKTIVTFSLLLLISGLSFGIISEAFAQDDAGILLKIVKRTQEQIQNQISNHSSDKIKNLFDMGTHHINSLEDSLHNNDVESAKEHFLSTMKIFCKEIRKYGTHTRTIVLVQSTSIFRKIYS